MDNSKVLSEKVAKRNRKKTIGLTFFGYGMSTKGSHLNKPGSSIGAEVKPLASHTMWLGFDSRTRRHMWVDVQLLLVLSSAPSGSVFSGYSGFRVSSKTNILKFQFYLERTDTFERVLLSCSLFRGYKKITLSYIQYIFALYTGKAVAIVKSCNEVETY